MMAKLKTNTTRAAVGSGPIRDLAELARWCRRQPVGTVSVRRGLLIELDAFMAAIGQLNQAGDSLLIAVQTPPLSLGDPKPLTIR